MVSPEFTGGPELPSGALAEGLLAAQRRLSSLDLPADAQIRMYRRLSAICDAMKSVSADVRRGARRLEQLLTELDRRDSAG